MPTSRSRRCLYLFSVGVAFALVLNRLQRQRKVTVSPPGVFGDILNENESIGRKFNFKTTPTPTTTPTPMSNSKTFMLSLSDSNNECSKELNRFFESHIATNTVFKEFFNKNEKNEENHTQFIAAVQVSANMRKNQPCRLEQKSAVLFWNNLPWKKFKGKDCDEECKKSIENLATKGTSTSLDTNDRSTVHTELQMLYGKRGRDFMKNAERQSNIIIMFSRSIPCSQLAEKKKGKACYGECAGDLKHYRANKKPGPMIISIYSRVYEEKRCPDKSHIIKNKDGSCNIPQCFIKTNEQVSNLYLEIGGIPSYQVKIEKDTVAASNLDLQNPEFSKNLVNPSTQIFPRLTFAGAFDKQSRLVKCIVEDTDLLWKIMGERRSVIDQFNNMRAMANAESMPDDRIREVIYRYISYKFVKYGVGSELERTDLHNKLISFYTNQNLLKRYDVCLKYARYYDFGVSEKFDKILKVQESGVIRKNGINAIFPGVMDEESFVNWETLCDKVISQLKTGIFAGEKEKELCKSLIV